MVCRLGSGRTRPLSSSGHRLYAEILRRMRDEIGLVFLQPGRFLMPPPGAQPPWMQFFPLPGRSPLARAMQARFSAYVDAVQRDLMSPMFGELDCLVVLADLLSPLHQGQPAFADAQLALAAAADALRWERSWTDYLAAFAQLKLPPSPIKRVAFVATKADHIAARQRGNLTSSDAAHHACAPSGRHPPYSRLRQCGVPRTLWKRWAAGLFLPSAAGSSERPALRAFTLAKFQTACPMTCFGNTGSLRYPTSNRCGYRRVGRGGIPQIGLDALASISVGGYTVMDTAPEPFLLLEADEAPRLEAAPPLLPAAALARRRSHRHWSGMLLLGASFLVLWGAWLVSSLFDRWNVLGWLGLAGLVVALALIGLGISRELRGLSALRRVDHLRAELVQR